MAENGLWQKNDDSGLTEFDYDAADRLSQVTDPNGSHTFSYDGMNRLIQETTDYNFNGQTPAFGFGYVGIGPQRPTCEVTLPRTIRYDAIYQLTQVTQSATTTESYTYDAVGNRLSSLGVSPYLYNASNELTSLPNVGYTYDSDGNTKTKTDPSGITTYTWDYENRLRV